MSNHIESISKAHDHFFKMAMTDHRVARDFFTAHLPNDLLAIVDLNCLELQVNDYIDDLRSEAITDMTFRTKINGQDAFLKLIVEHQSVPIRLMPFRVEKYCINYIDQYLKQHPKAKKIPLVIPIVLYHGEQIWRYSTDIRDIINAPKEIVDAYVFKPFILIDLNTIHDEVIKEHLWSGVMELALKHIFAKNTLPYVEAMMSLLQQIEQANGRGLVETVLIYLLDRGEMDQEAFLSIVRKELPSEVGEKVMTVSEQLIAKGIKQGMQQGVQQGIHQGELKGQQKTQLAIAKQLLANGQRLEFVAEMTGLAIVELERLTKNSQH